MRQLAIAESDDEPMKTISGNKGNGIAKSNNNREKRRRRNTSILLFMLDGGQR